MNNTNKIESDRMSYIEELIRKLASEDGLLSLYIYEVYFEEEINEYKELYPELFGEPNINENSVISLHDKKNNHFEFLDFSTVIKASQTISSEIIMDQLLITMMNVTIENAGAEKGLLKSSALLSGYPGS